MIDADTHAKYSPSGADRWATCTGSNALEENFPEQGNSDAAQEGTEAHELLERAVKAVTRPSTLEPEHPAALDVDQCYDLVEPLIKDPEWTVMSEVRVKLSDKCHGTADIMAFKGGLLKVIDYKHGRGIMVEVPSLQLEIYGAAAEKYLNAMLGLTFDEIETTIVQPRKDHPDGPVRTACYKAPVIIEKGEEILRIVSDIEEGKTSLHASEKACKWCRAKGSCEEQATVALKAAQSHFSPIRPEELIVPKKETSGLLPMGKKISIFKSVKFIRDFLNAVESSIEAGILAGEDVPGYKVVAGRSNRKFGTMEGDTFIKKSEEEIIELLTKTCKLKMTDIAPPKLLGPAPIEKLIDIKKRNGSKKMEALQSVIVKPKGKPTVVPETDKRAAITSHFGKVLDETKDPLN